MKKIRRFLQVMLFINFMIGMEKGMKPANLILIIVNGLLLISIAAGEVRRKDDGR